MATHHHHHHKPKHPLNEHVVTVGGIEVPPGQKRRIDVPIARLPTQSELRLPVLVINGAHSGPCFWISAAIHGDELNGVEIVREVIERVSVDTLHGTLIAVPIVNVFGFLNESRYLPDRRDLNRCFPGSPRGSMAARLAHLFMTEIASKCTYGIDLHTAGSGNVNFPQIRANLEDDEARRCALAFGASAVLHARMRDGSLRQAAAKKGIHILLYEAGEPLKFNSDAISTGVRGVLNVMQTIGMLPSRRLAVLKPFGGRSTELWSSQWVRARTSGILRLETKLGSVVEKHQRLGVIADAFGEDASPVLSPVSGMVIGLTTNPMVSQGQALVHVALTGKSKERPRPDKVRAGAEKAAQHSHSHPHSPRRPEKHSSYASAS